MANLNTKLADLTAAAERLNRNTDVLNEAIDVLNKRLQGLNIGIECWIECKQFNLGYAKISGKWGLALERGNDRWLFNDGPRQLRILAVDQILYLVKQMIADTEKLIKQVEERKVMAEAIVEAFLENSPSPGNQK